MFEKSNPEQMTSEQLLMQVCRLAGDRLRVKMEKIGLHRGQGFVLIYLWHNDGMAQQEIARAKHVSSATMTNILQRMERDGWVERRRDERDERIVRIYLTKKAKALHEKAHASFLELDVEATEALTDEERDTFHALLLKVHTELLERSPHCCRQRGGLHHCHGAAEERGNEV